MAMNRLLLCTVCLTLAHLGSVAAQPFVCDGVMYMALLSQDQRHSGLYAIRTQTNLADARLQAIREDLGIPVHVLAYNPADNYLYGFNSSNYHLYRIGRTGQLTDLGVPAFLDTVQFTYWAGDINPSGGNFLLVARSKTSGYDARFHTIRLNTSNLSAGYVSVVSDVPVRIEDIAYDPVLGELIGYDSANKRLVSINTSGVITAGRFSGTAIPLESLGSLFFDQTGRLYGYGGTTNLHHTLYEFDRTSGRLLGAASRISGRNSDGCGCPYQLHFAKRAEPVQILPCGEVRLTYRFHNEAGTSFGQVRITDTLPQGFSLLSVERPPFAGEVLSAPGSQVLDISGMQVLLGTDSIVIRAATAPLPPGRYGSRAIASQFPLALGHSLLSDDPATAERSDTTFIEIVRNSELLADTTVFLCRGASTVLQTSVQAQHYRWSNGAEGPAIRVDQPGWYWVEAEGDCGSYRDSIRVSEIQTGLTADLGPDRTVLAGQATVLALTHNSRTPLQYTWAVVSGSDSISCADCPSVMAQPFQPTTYAVTITDAYGCSASTQVTLQVKNDVPIFMPSAFSPNDDGINDTLFPMGAPEIAVEHFQIFDRWGAMLFQQTSGYLNQAPISLGWDGRYRGKPVPAGLYAWHLKVRLPDGSMSEWQGAVLLVR